MSALARPTSNPTRILGRKISLRDTTHTLSYHVTIISTIDNTLHTIQQSHFNREKGERRKEIDSSVMAEVKASSSIRTTTPGARGTTASSSASARSRKFASRASTTRSFNVQRPPVILEIGSSSFIKVGYAKDFKPKHLIPYEVPGNDDDHSLSSTTTQTRNESQWYSILAPLVQQVYDRLMINGSTRRVVVVHPQYPPKAWEEAFCQALWNQGVPAISMVSSMDMVPMAQGWKRGLMVQVGHQETVCMAHVDGHALSYTFQSVPCGYSHFLGDDSLVTEWQDGAMDATILDEHNPNSLVTAILRSLEACPRDIRLDVVSNIVIHGDGMVVLPNIAYRVGRRLKDIFEGLSEPLPPQEAKEGESKDDSSLRFSVVPLQTASLRPMAERLTLHSSAPHRADFLPWVGASLFAATWLKYDDDETSIPWKLNPDAPLAK